MTEIDFRLPESSAVCAYTGEQGEFGGMHYLRAIGALIAVTFCVSQAAAVTYAQYVFDFYGTGEAGRYQPGLFDNRGPVEGIFENVVTIANLNYGYGSFPLDSLWGSVWFDTTQYVASETATSGGGYGEVIRANISFSGAPIVDGLPDLEDQYVQSADFSAYTGSCNFVCDETELSGTQVHVRTIFSSSPISSQAISSFKLITSPIPEAPSWAIMVAGFGAIGGAMRRRQRMRVAFS